MIIGTAGHIDHGKTSLVRALTGVDTDRLAEEKRRGITIELGFAPLDLDGVGRVGVVDVPGHEAFVRTMVAGATGVDVGLIVVAADEGVMPQTREHAAVLDLLGVRHAVVAVTKCELVDAATLHARMREIAALLTGTAMAGAAAVAVSAQTGAGLDALRRALAAVLREIRARRTDDVVRLPVDRVFSKAGAGTVVTGTLWSGTIAVGDEVLLLPDARAARVRAMQVHEVAVDRAIAGSRVAVALAGIERSAVSRGDVLVRDDGWRTTSSIRADVRLLAGAPGLTPRSRVQLHLATAEVGARVIAVRNPATQPTTAIAGAELHAVRVVFDTPMVVRGGDHFVLRRSVAGRGATTVGGGVVTDAHPPRVRARAFAAPGLGVHERIAAMVTESAVSGVPEPSLAVRAGLAPRDVRACVDAIPSVVRHDTTLYARAALDSAAASVDAWVRAFHDSHPAAAGAPIEGVRTALKLNAHVTAAVVEALVMGNRIEHGPGGVVRAVAWRPAVSVAADAFKARLLNVLTAHGAAVPTLPELERQLGADVIPALRSLEKERSVTALTRDRYATVFVAEALWRELRGKVSGARVYTPSELRTLLGVSRQYVMAWLEYFDRQGHSVREAEGRRFRV